MIELFSDPQSWIALFTLFLLQIVLGIDNVIFIAILAGKLPADQQARARKLGLGLAVISRVLLLLSLAWLVRLTAPLFTVLGQEISGRDLILIAGGLFLIAKATHEMHQRLEGEEGHSSAGVKATFNSVILQILLLDVVFSLDSIVTAVGMVENVTLMIIAVVLATLVMIWFSGPLAGFVNRHPTVKVLALSFLLLIGLSLIAEGLDKHIPKGMIYFAMGFSVFVEMFNLRVRNKQAPVHLHEPYANAPEAT
ncbi:MAG TPA: TerC family protein [Gemmatimonadaceae bacterium]|nr:TerC family protein [Gemmatimonadaceae bacterium]